MTAADLNYPKSSSSGPPGYPLAMKVMTKDTGVSCHYYKNRTNKGRTVCAIYENIFIIVATNQNSTFLSSRTTEETCRFYTLSKSRFYGLKLLLFIWDASSVNFLFSAQVVVFLSIIHIRQYNCFQSAFLDLAAHRHIIDT
jgi:hypothetical protein